MKKTLCFTILFLIHAMIVSGGDSEKTRKDPEKTMKMISSENTVQLTRRPQGHHLTNINCWSHDGRFLYYDVRRDKDGSVFNGDRIERVALKDGKVETVYRSGSGACCGVVTCSPADGRVVFIHGPENPDAQWSYSFQHRRGVILHPDGRAETLDACNVVPPFVPGALRGGSHVHVFSADGRWISFTYNDHILDLSDKKPDAGETRDFDQRNIGLAVPLRAVSVNHNHPRNHDGSHFCVLVSRTVNRPAPGTDEIQKAYEEGWVGTDGYVKPDGRRQKRALVFLGDVALEDGKTAAEIFIVDLPESQDSLSIAAEQPLEGTMSRRPAPPNGVRQRRLTFTTGEKYPGVQGTRHWLRSSPDGTKIAFLRRDDSGVAQLRTVSPNGGEPRQWTFGEKDVVSALSWSPDGTEIACVMDNSVFACSEDKTVRLTERCEDEDAPLPYAVVYSPDGKKIAFMKNVLHEDGNRYDQIFVVDRQPQ